jgi:hypothetical protein
LKAATAAAGEDELVRAVVEGVEEEEELVVLAK